jgi:hypothetical protein
VESGRVKLKETQTAKADTNQTEKVEPINILKVQK